MFGFSKLLFTEQHDTRSLALKRERQIKTWPKEQKLRLVERHPLKHKLKENTKKMSYDEKLANRVRNCLKGKRGVSERKMFGGLCFMINGNMCCGVEKENLMVRVGPEQYKAALAKPHTRRMDFTGRPLKGFVYVSAQGYKSIASVKKIPISTGKMVPSAQMVEGIETAEGLPEMRKSRKTLSLFLRTYEVTNKFGGIRNKAISFLLEKEEETSNVDEEAD